MTNSEGLIGLIEAFVEELCTDDDRSRTTGEELLCELKLWLRSRDESHRGQVSKCIRELLSGGRELTAKQIAGELCLTKKHVNGALHRCGDFAVSEGKGSPIWSIVHR